MLFRSIEDGEEDDEDELPSLAEGAQAPAATKTATKAKAPAKPKAVAKTRA